jgi:hypothetical protein
MGTLILLAPASMKIAAKIRPDHNTTLEETILINMQTPR